MLKKDLQREYDLSQELLREKYNILNKQERELKALKTELDDVSKELAHHEKTQEQVLALIDSLSVILCPDSVEYERNIQGIIRYGLPEGVSERPEKPKDQIKDKF